MNPTIGDLLDRLFILGLKIEQCYEVGVDAKHFKDEAAAIGVELETFGSPGASGYCRMARLAAINAMIWFAEEAVPDELPSNITLGEQQAHLNLLMHIRTLNRDRAKVIDAFEPARGKEKIYDESKHKPDPGPASDFPE
jgi:hypothetical protein